MKKRTKSLEQAKGTTKIFVTLWENSIMFEIMCSLSECVELNIAGINVLQFPADFFWAHSSSLYPSRAATRSILPLHRIVNKSEKYVHCFNEFPLYARTKMRKENLKITTLNKFDNVRGHVVDGKLICRYQSKQQCGTEAFVIYEIIIFRWRVPISEFLENCFCYFDVLFSDFIDPTEFLHYTKNV